MEDKVFVMDDHVAQDFAAARYRQELTCHKKRKAGGRDQHLWCDMQGVHWYLSALQTLSQLELNSMLWVVGAHTIQIIAFRTYPAMARA